MIDLQSIGWNESFESAFKQQAAEDSIPGRVTLQSRKSYKILCSQGEVTAEVSGKFFFEHKENTSTFPVTGDWCVIKLLENNNRAVITSVLPRKSVFSRKNAGNKTVEQVIAANIDVLFIMTSMNEEFNTRRLERYLTLAFESNSKPVVILSKSDLAEDIDYYVSQAESVSYGLPVHNLSVHTGDGLEQIMQYFENNNTVALVGSSGVGKTSLANKLLGDNYGKTQEVTLYKDKGAHTTTTRYLVRLPGGGMLLDTPGMRELQLWDAGEGLTKSFSDIEQIQLECKFSNCSHANEPGCAVNEALENGSLEPERYENYLKMQREIKYYETRKDNKARLEQKKHWKHISKQQKQNYKNS